jgi:LPPG:FO 2-phospho-L-lactate transferase
MRIVALAGGVGGAKLAFGLAQILAPHELTIIVNTADDFEHLGLHISPDLDTVCYTLAGMASTDTGWGRRHETWNTLTGLERLGGPAWFRLGDRDLATHLERTRRLRLGEPLNQIVREFCQAWGVEQTVLPMTDAAVRTIVRTNEGALEFQAYLVERRCEPEVTGFEFRGAEQATPAAGAIACLESADGIVICPSNPWVSIGPILSIPGIRAAVVTGKTVAISPIIGGTAVRGPAAKMYRELGFQPSALAVAEHYRDIASAFVLDQVDSSLERQIQELGFRTLVCKTLMRTNVDRRRLAVDVLNFLQDIKQ